MKTVFEFSSYRAYLSHLWGGGARRSGNQGKAAAAIGCHSTLLSHVLHGKQHLSLEQSERLNGFLKHAEGEAHFFLLLVQRERAGTDNLRDYFTRQLKAVLDARMILANRVPEKREISREDEGTFYSSWLYGAAHVLLSLPKLRTKTALAEYLRVTPARAGDVLEFLSSIGLAVRSGQEYRTGTNHVHLSGESRSIAKHHTNWRMRAIESLDSGKPEDLHYSAVATLSLEDAKRLRELLLADLRKYLELIGSSKEEEAFVYSFDFFPLNRN